jgi:ComF family protein
MLSALLQLVFPRLCVTCNHSLRKNESHICTKCLINLPQTRFHETIDNPLAKTFWGRLTLEHAYSFLYFRKGNAVQHILHEIKYKSNRDLARFIGSYYGAVLSESGIKPDGIAAIPLHPQKMRKRGYNQSELIVAGMCESMQIENLSPFVERITPTETQTKKSRFARWENVEEVFRLKEHSAFAGKHLLLMDDVITTGATIEACGKQILQAPHSKLSVASIAFATN